MRAAVAEHRAVELIGILYIDKIDFVDGLMCLSAGIVACRSLGVNRAEPLRLIILINVRKKKSHIISSAVNHSIDIYYII